MHELSIVQSVVEICAARAAEQGANSRVTHITLEVGALAAVIPDALRFCFEACTKETMLDGAELEIIEIPGRARCLDCAGEVSVTRLFGTCECGSAKLILIAGEELKIKQMEVEECA
ncbi:hydrogenase maturation nickel metallochaperone HypA [Propionivibrio sp.]|uniref:hydrogenase maturation nickel metallochaperone HypA n=1 Tax=Propionivibrio sp. TaxID=2212460 RepID=UPI003BF0755D